MSIGLVNTVNHFVNIYFRAQMVKLVDTLDSGSSGRKAVEVQILFWAKQDNSFRDYPQIADKV